MKRTFPVVALLVAAVSVPALADPAGGSFVKARAIGATQSHGKITGLEGTVQILRGGVTSPISKGALLTAGDRLLVNRDGRAQWWMEDDSVFVSAPGSGVQIDRFERGLKNASYTLMQGAVRSVAGTIPFTVHTAVGDVTRAQGDFAAILCGEGCDAAKGLYVFGNSGQVVVANGAGTVNVGKGQVVFVPQEGGAPQLMAKPPQVVLAINMTLQFMFVSTDVEVEVDVDPPILTEPPVSPS